LGTHWAAQGDWKGALLAGLSLALQLPTHVQIPFFTSCIMVVYTLWRLMTSWPSGPWKRSLANVAVSLVLCLTVAGAVLALLAPWLLDGDLAIISPTELGSDFVTKQWPNAAYIVQAWQQWSDVPLWRTTALGGVPIIGNPSMLLAYPLYWLVFLFPISWAFTFYFALHLIWVGWGVYGFARQVLRLSPGAALLAALSFALSAKVVAHLGGGHIDIIAAVAWLPWLWWAGDGLARRPSWLSVMGTAVAAAAQAVTHLPTLWLSALVVGCWGLYVRLADRAPGTPRQWLWSGVAGLGALVLAIGLSAVQLWPMLELLPLSTRSAMTLSEATRHALPVPLLVGLVLSTALAFPEWAIYAGVVTLALAPASWLARDLTRGWRFFVALVILGTVFSLGCATPLYPLLFRILPGMNWLRVPPRMMFLVQLAWALLAGMGCDAVRQAKLQRIPALVGWWTVLILLSAVGTLWSHWFPGILAVPKGSVVVAILTLIVLVGQSWVRVVQPYAPVMLAVLVVLEAMALAPQFIARGRMSTLAMPTRVVDFLASQPGHFRVYSPRGLVSLAQAVAHGLETADGNDPFQFDHYVRWMSAASGCDLEAYSVSVPACAGNEVDPEAYKRAQPNKVLLGIGNVRYVVTDHVLDQWSSLVWQSDSVWVYENPAVLPQAFVVPAITAETDDAATLTMLQSYNPTEIATVTRAPEYASLSSASYHVAQVISRQPNRIEVQADGPGWLVLSEVWAPGWQAAVDGTQTEVYRTDVAFCGLPLPDGSHVVSLMYAPTGWVWGRWISLSMVAATAVATAIVLWNRCRHASTGAARK
jgi:hypothetical protein